MAGTSFPTLTAGAIARASDVLARTNWIEGSIVPMSGGATTTGTLDLGTTTAYWRVLYANSINATSTANGIAIGTTTVVNNSDVAFEMAGIKAMLLPRLTTAQRNNLAGINGMVIYNSTSNQVQKYENGAWAAMGGSTIGLAAKFGASTTSTLTQTAVSIVAPGRILTILGTTVNPTDLGVSMNLDSIASGEIISNTTTLSEFRVANTITSANPAYIWLSTSSNNVGSALGIYFKSSLDIFYRNVNVNAAVSVACLYERT